MDGETRSLPHAEPQLATDESVQRRDADPACLSAGGDSGCTPLVIIVTGQGSHAVDGSLLDSVLNPDDVARFRSAALRAIRALTTIPSERQRPQQTEYLNRVFVKSGDRLVHLPTEQIDSIEALGTYVKLRSAKSTYVLRASISALENRLDPDIFVRTHRSFIVNVTRIRELVPVSHGDYRITLDRGGSAPLSRTYRDRLQMFVLSAAVGEQV